MSWIFPALISALCSTLVFTVLYLYLYWQEKEPCLKSWTLGWALLVVHIASLVGMVSWQRHFLLVQTYYQATLWSCLALLGGTLSYRGRRMHPAWLGGGLLTALWIVVGQAAGVDFFWFTLPQYLFTGSVLIYTGLLWLGSRQTPTFTRWAAGVSFLLWGAHKLDFPFLRPLPGLAPWGYLLASLLTTLAAVTIPLAFLQRAKRQAESEHHRLQQLADGLPVHISHVDRNLRHLFVNQAYRRWLGLDDHQTLVGRTMPEVLGREVFQGLAGHVEQVLSGRPVEFEDVRTPADGEKRYLYVRYMPAYDAQGRVAGFYGLQEDITARRQAERAHRISEHKFAAAFNAAPVSLVISTQAEGRILEVNDTFCRATGYQRQEVVGRTTRELGLWSNPAARQHLLELLQRQAKVDNLPLTLVDREGRDHYCLVSCRPLDHQGEPCLLALVVDITDKVVAEQEKGDLERQLRQARHMEAVGTLAGGIAHDFNNILAAILGYSELVRDELPPRSQARTNQEKVLQAAKRARKLIKQILTFSQQGVSQACRPVRLAAVLEEALGLLKSSLPSSVELRLDLHASRAVVMADPTRLHQVIMNLCINAAQAMEPDGGVLSVSLREEYLDQHPILPPGSYLCLEVRDTGQGMDSHEMARIFEPYFTTKQPGHGTGLGLSVVHGIVQDLGGTIKVASSPGRGSCFRVYLPRPPAETTSSLEQATPEPGATLPLGKGERILLVDDEEDLAEMCRQALERLGYRVTAFHNSPEALAAFQADPTAFDLVITDQTMPRLTGPALARKITRLRPDIPVIMYTGYTSGDTAPPPETGIREILPKPLGLHSLAWAVRRVLDQS